MEIETKIVNGVRSLMTYLKNPTSSISPKIEKKELKKDYFGMVATRAIKKGEILLIEQAFATYYTSTERVHYNDFCTFLKKYADQEKLRLLYPRTDEECVKEIHRMNRLDKRDVSHMQLLTQLKIEKREAKINGKPLDLVFSYLWAKVRRNMFDAGKLGVCLFEKSSNFNSGENLKFNALYAIAAKGCKREITFRAVKDIAATEEVVTYYGEESMVFDGFTNEQIDLFRELKFLASKSKE